MATTPYPFVANAVLTASQLNSTFNIPVTTKTASAILVAADAGTRVVMNSASATTITVNTSLFAAGDNLEITNIGAGVCTITAGTATVSTSGTLALVANAGGTLYFTSAGVSVFIASGVAASASGLTLISATTIGTTVASVTVSSAFSATYDNYKIIISGGVGPATRDTLLMTLGSTATGYYWAQNSRTFADADNSGGGANNSSWRTGGASSTTISMCADVFQPFLADQTSFASTSIFATTTGAFFSGGGYLDNTTSYTAFTITVGSGTLTGGTIRVYGYSNS
jgi:hypothetical protein